MEKRRIRLEINGVVCGLITQESEEYMESLAQEVGEMMRQIQEASPFITREAAALTVALSYCDDAKKNGRKAFELQERIDELEVEAELWQEEKASLAPQADPALQERLEKLEAENTAMAEKAGQLEKVRSRLLALEDENAALREAAASAAKPVSAPAPRDTGASEQLQKELEALRQENQRLKAAPQAAAPAPRPASPHGKNPLRYEDELQQEGIVSFFEIQDK